jgi:hypothetical protein
VYSSAHGVASRTGLSFEDAFILTRLVLQEGGGPVACRGRKAMIKKPTEKALMELGLIELHGASEFTQRVYIQLNVDSAIRELLDRRAGGVKITPVEFTEHVKFVAVATQAAFDLVSECLPS